MVNTFRWMIFVIVLAVVIGSIMVTSAENPTITIYSPPNYDTVDTDTITVSGGASRGTDGAVVESVTVNGYLAEGTNSWRKVISLQLGQNKITAVATDRSGKCGEDIIYVTYIEPNSISTNESSPTLTPTFTTISKGGYRPAATPAPIPTPTPTPTGSISITTIPPGAEVYLDTYPKDTSPTGITNITLENVTEGWHKIKVIKEGYRSEPFREIYLWDSETRKLDIELKPLKGSITVNSTPVNASVYLDNVYIKNKSTPCMLSEVVVGQHTIKLTKSGYDDEIRNVSIFAGRTTHLHENLTECTSYGSIDISSDPSGAKVYLDDVYTKDTPCMLSEVVVGQHNIKLTNFGYDDEIRNVSVSVGETRHLHVKMTGYGSLRISSYPSRAKVYLDGDYKGITPLDISEVVVGSYSIKLTKFGYAAMEKKIDVSAGKREAVDETLSVSAWLALIAMLSAIALEEAAIGFIRKRIIPFIRSIKKNSVPGDDDEKFKKFLRDDCDIDWAENAEIIKSDDGKTISIFKDKNSAEIIIDEMKEKASLKISDGRTLDLKVKKENGKLNIYKVKIDETKRIEKDIVKDPREKHLFKLGIEAPDTIEIASDKVNLGVYSVRYKTPRITSKPEFVDVGKDFFDDIKVSINNVTENMNKVRGARGDEEEKSEEYYSRETLETLRDLGCIIYKQILPSHVIEELSKQQQIKHLELSISEDLGEYPWEAMHDDSDEDSFLCLKYALGRTIQVKGAVGIPTEISGDKLKALVIGDPLEGCEGELPMAKKEAEEVEKKLIEVGVEVKTLIGESATCHKVLSELGRGYDIIHYAGHAEFDMNEPRDSYLILRDEKHLKAKNITKQFGVKKKQKPFFAYINACKAGKRAEHEEKVEDIEYTNDVAGLASAFLEKGIYYIGSVWPIHDDASADAAIYFYDNFLNGVSIGESLRKAKVGVYEKYKGKRTAWAGLVLYGNPTLTIVSE